MRPRTCMPYVGKPAASLRWWSLAVATAWALLAAQGAQATVTVGSPLGVSFESAAVICSSPCTAANQALPEAGANATSPVSGVIIRWRTSGHYQVGPFKLRVLRPAGGGAYSGMGTSGPVTPAGTGTETWVTSLPIRAGDLIGIDDLGGTVNDEIGAAGVVGSMNIRWASPRLMDGSTAGPSTSGANFELGFNADVQPTNTFSIGRVARNKKKGTATVDISVPNPGEITGSGNGAKVASAAGAAISRVVNPGNVQLLIKAKGKKKRKLNAGGKVTLNLALTYTPTGGDPTTQSLKLKLKKR